MKCRHCHTAFTHCFVDLGSAPPSNAYLSDPKQQESRYPLRVMVCDTCWLVQTEDFVAADALFDSDYAYFSSVSQSWLAHAAQYSRMITQRLKLNSTSQVVEIAANDGYLLKNFVAAGIPCLGIEPTNSTADAAEKLGVPVLRAFFGEALAQQMAQDIAKADLIIGNNVYAHVPDINDFTLGMKTLLTPGGTITLEFPHLLPLIAHTQFDTIYHEHFSYLSLLAVEKIFATAGLRVCDVETLPTHGGSLRIYGCHGDDVRAPSDAVLAMRAQEKAAGLHTLAPYQGFQKKVEAVRDEFRAFLAAQKREGKKIAAYGAAAKGNTLLNFAGVTAADITCVYDGAPSKQGKYLPGSHIPVVAPAQLTADKPDTIIIFPWNIAAEIVSHHPNVKAQWVSVVPTLTYYTADASPARTA